MKILYIANSRIPSNKAHANQILKMCEKFSQQNVNVTLILPTRKNPSFKKVDPFEYHKIKKVFELKKIWSFDPTWLMKLPQGIYIKFQLLFFIKSLILYLFFLKNRSQYIFYTRDEYLLPILQLFSKRVVWEGHSLPRRKNRYISIFKKCYRISVLTNNLKSMLVDLGISQKKILVSPDAVELEIFGISMDKDKARKEMNLPEDKIILGYTGTYKTKNMDKGIRDTLKAMQVLKKEYPSLFLVCIGGSPEDIEYYNNMAKDLDLSDQVMLLGKVDQKILAIYNQAFDISMMPFPKTRHFAYFMSPLKLFEYMAAGRPIIATDLPSERDVLNEGNAVIVKPDDPQDLSQGIKKLIDQPEFGQKIASQSLIDVKQYTWHKRVEKIIEFLYETS